MLLRCTTSVKAIPVTSLSLISFCQTPPSAIIECKAFAIPASMLWQGGHSPLWAHVLVECDCHAVCTSYRFEELYMEERMEAIGEIVMEAGYPTVLCFQVGQGGHK